MTIRSALTQLSRPQCPAYDYKTPVLILVLLAWYMPWYLTLPPGYAGDPYDGGIFILILLFNYLDGLARWFKWRLAGAIHVITWGWIVFALFYFIYWSRVLYPIHVPAGN